MPKIDQSDAEVALRKWADKFADSDGTFCGLTAEAKASGVHADGIDVQVWREAGGKPHFKATIIFTGEEYWHIVMSDKIIVELIGTFAETRHGLAVDSHEIRECDFEKTDSLAADEYWRSQESPSQN